MLIRVQLQERATVIRCRIKTRSDLVGCLKLRRGAYLYMRKLVPSPPFTHTQRHAYAHAQTRTTTLPSRCVPYKPHEVKKHLHNIFANWMSVTTMPSRSSSSCLPLPLPFPCAPYKPNELNKNLRKIFANRKRVTRCPRAAPPPATGFKAPRTKHCRISDLKRHYLDLL